MSLSKSTILASAASIAMMLAPGFAQAAFVQGFEVDASGWSPGAGSITRVASGDNGITSADGDFHAVVSQGAFTNSGTQHGDPWHGFITTSIDVYIDTEQGAVGDGWAWDTAVFSLGAAYIEGGGFGARKTGAGEWSFAADGDGAAYPGGGVQVSTSGWLRFVSTWGDNGGLLTRNSYLYDSADQLLYSNEQTTAHSTAGLSSRHYSWFANIGAGVGTLAIDNSFAAVPEPATIGLAGLGLLGMFGVARRRGAK